MAQLTFVKLHDDGASLLLRSHDGAEYHLPVCANLREAVLSPGLDGSTAAAENSPNPSPDNSRLDDVDAADSAASDPANSSQEEPMSQPRTDAASPRSERGSRRIGSSPEPLRPAEIQAQLRAGASVAELAERTGTDAARIRRFENAIVSEREYVIASVRDHRVQGFSGSATVGELADARLLARGVDLGDVAWTALRHPGMPWRVEVCFPAGKSDRYARWNYDLRRRHLTPLDDEARWLSQADDPITADVVAVPLSQRIENALDKTDAILQDLDTRRGRRLSDPLVRPEATGTKAAAAKAQPVKRVGTKDGSRATAKQTTGVATAEIDVHEAVEPQPVTSRAPVVELNPGNRATGGNRPARAKRTKATRAAMPSWDDIMLGPKRED